MDIYGFFDAIEILSQKIYKDETQPDKPLHDSIDSFITASTEFFEDFLEK